MHAKKLLLVLLAAACVAAFFAFDLGRFLTLDYVKSRQVEFAALYVEHRLAVLGAFFAVYVGTTALSLPGATVLTLLGAGLFGFWTALITVSFASAIGATLACLTSRFVLRDWVQGRFGERLGAVNRGLEREGALYLFTMRLIPAIPFFVINLLMGLSPMRLATFYWVSQLGMLPGTAVYVNAGVQLSRIESLRDIVSPGLLASFVLLGLFPLAARKIMARVRSRAGLRPGPPDARA